jgi:glycosyltransferase involved in cell wall biosynthesis/ribosomal protein S18 acetylase RimI-like enzyme/O-antigen ligase
MSLRAEPTFGVTARPLEPGQVWAPWGGVRVSLSRLDVVGFVLFGAGAAWMIVVAVAVDGSPLPAAALFLGCAVAFAAGRSVASRGSTIIPGAVVVMAAGLVIASPLGTWSAAPLSGPLGYANAKAALFVQAAVAAVMLVIAGRTHRVRRAALVAAVIFAAVPWFSRSFAAAIPLVLLPVIGLVAARRWNIRRAVLLGAPILVAAIVATVLLARGAGPGVAEAASRDRIRLWDDALTMVEERPLTGIGPGRFAELSPNARDDPDLRWAHSGFLQQAAETGILGFALLLGVFLWAFARLAVAPGHAGLPLLAGYGVLLLGVHAGVDYVLHFPDVPLIAAVLVGSACGDGALQRQGRLLRRGRVAYVTSSDLTLRFILIDEMRRLRERGFDVTAISAPGPWVGDIEAEGIRHLPWRNVVRAWNPVADARALRELWRILREGFDVVHTHTPKAGVLGRLAARLADVPAVVNTVHGYYATPADALPKRLTVLGVENLAARCSDLELFVGEEDYRWASRSGVVSPGKRVLVGTGVDLSRFDPVAGSSEERSAIRGELGVPNDALLVSTMGRLVAEKGYRELFSAARRVRSARPDVRFVVLGSTDIGKRDAIGEQELDLVRDDVVFAGWREDVRDVLAASDIFVLPSWREGVPRSAIEAAAMGLPLILTDIRGCREVVRDGVEGLLVPPRAPDRLAGAIEQLVEDPELRRRMGAAARARALERFDERRVFERIRDAYDRLLAAKGLRPRPRGPTVRPATPDDASVIARLHRATLPDAFLPRLGDRFLRRLYRAMAGDPEAVLLVSENGEGVVGFAAGTPSVTRFYRRFKRRHGVPVALLLLPRLARRDVRRRLRETARYPNGMGTTTDAELLSIGVAPEHERGGIGRRLASELLTGLSERGAEEVRVVVAASNRRANRFYQRIGFRPAGTIAVHEGAASNVLLMRCRS